VFQHAKLVELGATFVFEGAESFPHAGEDRAVGVGVRFEGLDEPSLAPVDLFEHALARLHLRFPGALRLAMAELERLLRGLRRPTMSP
jgi:hypothetical protein